MAALREVGLRKPIRRLSFNSHQPVKHPDPRYCDGTIRIFAKVLMVHVVSASDKEEIDSRMSRVKKSYMKLFR